VNEPAAGPQLRAVQTILHEIRPTTPDIHTEVGIKNGEAYLVLRARDGSKVAHGWAVIRTPGARWYSVELGADHEHDVVDEEASMDEVRGYLRRFVMIATAYLKGEYDVIRSRWLRGPILVVRIEDQQLHVNPKLGWTLTSRFRRKPGMARRGSGPTAAHDRVFPI
jgi:hypothetical protein